MTEPLRTKAEIKTLADLEALITKVGKMRDALDAAGFTVDVEATIVVTTVMQLQERDQTS